MRLLQFSVIEERTAMKRLFEYVYLRALGNAGTVTHYCDSTLEQACRFLWYFDPEGRTDIGYTPQKKLSDIHDLIDDSDFASLPSIEAYLDTALSMNAHFHGIGAKNINEPMTFDPTLEPTLQEMGILEKNGFASDPLLIDAIDRWCFFDKNKRELSPEAREFLDRIGEAVWRDASNENKKYLFNGLERGSKYMFSLETWFERRWRFGAWLKNGEWENDDMLFRSHTAIGCLMMASIKTGLEEGRIQPR